MPFTDFENFNSTVLYSSPSKFSLRFRLDQKCILSLIKPQDVFNENPEEWNPFMWSEHNFSFFIWSRFLILSGFQTVFVDFSSSEKLGSLKRKHNKL